MKNQKYTVKLALNREYVFSKSFEDKNQRQLSDGRVGRWKEILNDDDIRYINQRFSEFDIKLSDFISV